ncbi:unnamed protein product, partial [Closterium sp. NIES-65]
MFLARTTEMKPVVERGAPVGFPRISEYTGVNSGTVPKYNNTVVHVTPPDVTLCVGNGFIVHAVNCALVVYDTKGKQLTRIIPQNETTWTRKTLLRHQSWATTSVASPALMIARRDASIFRPSGS